MILCGVESSKKKHTSFGDKVPLKSNTTKELRSNESDRSKFGSSLKF